jgi:YD repeat-containing protein
MKKIMLALIVAMFSLVGFAQDKKQTEIKVDQLPKEVTKWVTNNIPGGKITKAGKIEENGVVSYAAVVEARGQKHGYMFDKNGKFTGKADRMNQTAPVAKPPVKAQEAKPTTKTSASDDAAPKK